MAFEVIFLSFSLKISIFQGIFPIQNLIFRYFCSKIFNKSSIF